MLSPIACEQNADSLSYSKASWIARNNRKCENFMSLSQRPRYLPRCLLDWLWDGHANYRFTSHYLQFTCRRITNPCLEKLSGYSFLHLTPPDLYLKLQHWSIRNRELRHEQVMINVIQMNCTADIIIVALMQDRMKLLEGTSIFIRWRRNQSFGDCSSQTLNRETTWLSKPSGSPD